MPEAYDVLIVGGGPAGLTAGLYVSRSRLQALLLEKGLPGGQIVNAPLVENYPGFPQGIEGLELGERMLEQATSYGLQVVIAQVEGVELEGPMKEVRAEGKVYQARAVVIAAGSEHRKLGVPGEEKLQGKGISYCAMCDAPLFGEQVVVVVGGGDAALTDALFLSRFASQITVIHRRRELRASAVLQERAFAEPRLEFLWDTVVEEVLGEGRVEELRLRRVDSGEKSTLRANGVFVAIGLEPNTHIVEGKLKLGPGRDIITNEFMETDVPGVFAAGDVRYHSPRQVVAAAGDGATAALSVVRYLRDVK